MAGTTSIPQQQLASSAPSAVSGTPASSADEEAFKRNTDCVYFLASPLTCKKGSECEYRHSETARINPRDCWYWMHGNCLNAKCSFRHPPLEGLFGTQVSTPKGASLPQSYPAVAPSAAPVSFGSGASKQAVPCVFFQKGYCMRGDWCSFLHAPNTVSNKSLPGQAPIAAAETSTFKKSFAGPEKPTQEKQPPQTSARKAVEVLSQARPTPKVEFASRKDEPFKESKYPASSSSDELRVYRISDVPSVENGTQVSWSSRGQQSVSLKDNANMNGKDAEEVSREPSPGFDVLVDNELGDSVYYPSEDQYGRPDDGEGRNKYFDSRSADYSKMVETDQDIYHDSRGYDSYERQGRYGWEQRRPSSERMSSGVSARRERSQYGRTGSPDQADESDLRHHLSKHSRASGLRSVINQDYTRERRDQRRYQNPRRDLRQDHEPQRNSVSSRLQGRIKMPDHSSDDGNEMQRGRRNEGQRAPSGLSQLPSRLRNRIKDTVQVDIHNDSINKRGLPIRREVNNEDHVDFAGPKSLAELKSKKSAETNNQHVDYQPSAGKRKYSEDESTQHTEGHVSFDGPKPLQDILKRKRGDERGVSGVNNEDNNLQNIQNKVEDGMMNNRDKNGVSFHNDKENEASRSTSGVKIEKGSALLTDDQSLVSPNHIEAEDEGEMIAEDGAVYQEAEDYAQEDDDYYEQGDGEAYDLDEGDNGDPEGEYLDADDDDDDDDDDDFAKKMGVMN